MNGYDLCEKVFVNIGKDKKHKISMEDMIRVISFWGLNEEAPKTSKIGFVCSCARDRMRDIIEKALVYGDFREYEKFNNYMMDMRGDTK